MDELEKDKNTAKWFMKETEGLEVTEGFLDLTLD